MKDYYGKCGMCRHCELGTAYTSCYTTTFTCTKYNRSVKADEKGCSAYDPASGRTNDTVARYDR